MPRIAQFGEKFKNFFFFTLSRPTLRIFSAIFVPRKREEQSSASRFQFPSYYLEKGQTLRRGAWASWPIPASKIRKFRTSRKGRHLEKFGDFVPRKRDEIFVPRKREEQSTVSRFQFPSYYLEKGQTLRKNSEGGRGAWASWTWMNFQIFVPRVRVDTWKNFAISYLEKGTRFSYLEKGTRFSYLEKGRRLGFEKLA